MTIGRTGRAGHRGKAITFFTEQDTTNLRSIAAIMRDSGCEIPNYMLTMKKHSKKERRKLERSAPARERISTILKFKQKYPAKTKAKTTDKLGKGPIDISEITEAELKQKMEEEDEEVEGELDIKNGPAKKNKNNTKKLLPGKNKLMKKAPLGTRKKLVTKKKKSHNSASKAASKH